MDQAWEALVKEGKEVAGRADKDQWHLGELAAMVEGEYSKNRLGEYASVISVNHGTLNAYRVTARRWPDKKMRPPIFSVAYTLNRHPNRFEIIRCNPGMSRDDARVLMTEWRDAQPGPKRGRPPKPKVDPSIPLNNRRQVEAEIERQVADRVDDWMDKVRPHLEEATAVKAGRRGLISKEDAAAIKRCLHPDNSASLEMRNRAFVIWQRIEHLLMSEQDAPTFVNFPRRKKAA
jgi:hypothetical protein